MYAGLHHPHLPVCASAQHGAAYGRGRQSLQQHCASSDRLSWDCCSLGKTSEQREPARRLRNSHVPLFCLTTARHHGNNLAANAPVPSSPALRSTPLARQATGARSGPSQRRAAPGTPLECSRARAAQRSGRPALTELPLPYLTPYRTPWLHQPRTRLVGQVARAAQQPQADAPQQRAPAHEEERSVAGRAVERARRQQRRQEHQRQRQRVAESARSRGQLARACAATQSTPAVSRLAGYHTNPGSAGHAATVTTCCIRGGCTHMHALSALPVKAGIRPRLPAPAGGAQTRS